MDILYNTTDISNNISPKTRLPKAKSVEGIEKYLVSLNIPITITEKTIPTNNNQLTNGAGFIDGSALNATNLSSGTIPDARFPATLPAVSGANLTNLPAADLSSLNASNLSSGTIPDARFPDPLPAVSAANLTNLPSGTVGGGNEKLFVEAENQMDNSFTTTSNFNYVAASPMTIASSATLTISANSTMTFV